MNFGKFSTKTPFFYYRHTLTVPRTHTTKCRNLFFSRRAVDGGGSDVDINYSIVVSFMFLFLFDFFCYDAATVPLRIHYVCMRFTVLLFRDDLYRSFVVRFSFDLAQAKHLTMTSVRGMNFDCQIRTNGVRWRHAIRVVVVAQCTNIIIHKSVKRGRGGGNYSIETLYPRITYFTETTPSCSPATEEGEK